MFKTKYHTELCDITKHFAANCTTVSHSLIFKCIMIMIYYNSWQLRTHHKPKTTLLHAAVTCTMLQTEADDRWHLHFRASVRKKLE